MPSESDRSGDTDALRATSALLRERGEKDKLWLVHRLDRVVGGVMVLARTRSAAAELSQIISERVITKEYIAVTEGIPEEGEYNDCIVRDAARGMAIITDRSVKGARPCSLSLRVLSTVEGERGARSLVHITLHTGRFHQIRAQLSHRAHPVLGDGKYGSHDKRGVGIALFSHRIELPMKKGTVTVSALPDAANYPWSLFDPDLLKEI